MANEQLFCPYATFIWTSVAALIALRLRRQATTKDQEKDTTVMSKQRILQLRQQHFSKSVSISYANSNPLLIVKGKGSRLIDEQGVSYLDTRNNVAHCGHSHPDICRAIQHQVATLNTNTRYLHPNVALLAKKLAAKLPPPLQVVFFVNSGSEANDLALRLARAYSGSNNTIVVEGSYHGHTNSVLEVSPYKYQQSKEFDLTKPSETCQFKTPGRHIYQVPAPDVYRGEFQDMNTAGPNYARYVEEACEFYTQAGEKVGAFIVEGGMSVPGVILPPPGYLQTSVAAVRKAGGVWIADEVQTGLGRFGSCFWAFEYQHDDDDDKSVVVPDIVTIGKPFGNGMPLAACVTTPQIAQAFEAMGVEYFNTFGGNPVCAAAGLAVLDTIERERLQQHALEMGSYLQSKFWDLQLDLIGDVRGSGLFLGVELVRNKRTKEPATEETSFVCSVLKERYHILTSIDGIYENVLILKPPMCFSRGDCNLLVDRFRRAVVDDLAAAGDVRALAKTPT